MQRSRLTATSGVVRVELNLNSVQPIRLPQIGQFVKLVSEASILETLL
jgi:hypothetical protein